MAESSLQAFGQNSQSEIGGIVIAVIIMGCVIFLIGFLGFCGAFLKSACTLILVSLVPIDDTVMITVAWFQYGVLLGILTIGLIAGGIAGLVLRQEVR